MSGRAQFPNAAAWARMLTPQGLAARGMASLHLDSVAGYEQASRASADVLAFSVAALKDVCAEMEALLAKIDFTVMLTFYLGEAASLALWDDAALSLLANATPPPEIFVLHRRNFFYFFVESYNRPLDPGRWDGLSDTDTKDFGSLYSCARSVHDLQEDEPFLRTLNVFRMADT